MAEEFRAKCRAIAELVVVEAWAKEVEERGPHWIEASRLLAAYGYGRPAQATEEAEGKIPLVIAINRYVDE